MLAYINRDNFRTEENSSWSSRDFSPLTTDLKLVEFYIYFEFSS